MIVRHGESGRVNWDSTVAERRWRRINAPQLVPIVRAGVGFADGVALEATRAA